MKIDAKSFRVREISDELRDALEPELVDLIADNFVITDRKEAADHLIFNRPDGRLHLLYDEQGRVAALVSAGLSVYRVRGRSHAVIEGAMFSRPDVRGLGIYGARFAARLLLGWKLRHPFKPTGYVGNATSPAAYCLVRRHSSGAYPRPGVQAPKEIDLLLREVMARRGMAIRDDDPWKVVLSEPILLRDPERMRNFVEKTEDPNAEYYVRRNPRYLKGEWLAVYIPIRIFRLIWKFCKLHLGR